MYQIITDTSALFTPEQGKEMGIEVLPLSVTIGDWQGRDLLMDMERFYGYIKNGHLPQSSQPPIGEVIDAYEKYAGKKIINITMADGLSGTYQSAEGAREAVDNCDDIVVVNSKTLCGPHRYIVEKAVKMQQEGKSFEEVVEWVRFAADHNESFLIPQDFGYLKRGGRLAPMTATLGTILKLKPIMAQTPDGRQLEKLGVKRTMKAALADVVERLKNKGVDEENYIMHVSHADAIGDAEYVVGLLKEAFPKMEIQILDLSPAFVTQGGPKCVAIQYCIR